MSISGDIKVDDLYSLYICARHRFSASMNRFFSAKFRIYPSLRIYIRRLHNNSLRRHINICGIHRHHRSMKTPPIFFSFIHNLKSNHRNPANFLWRSTNIHKENKRRKLKRQFYLYSTLQSS